MKIGYNKIQSYFYIGLGILIGLFQLLILIRGGDIAIHLPVVTLALAFFGFSTLKGTYFELQENKVVVHAAVGNATRDFAFEKLSEFTVEGKKVYYFKDGKKKKLPVSAFTADKQQFQAFLEKIKSA